jgi:regulatory protein
LAEKKKPRTALMCAMDLLALREHFTKELTAKLRLREFEPADIELAIEKARESGWQSDERACESYVRSRMNKGYGRQKVLSELYKRGASNSLIERWLPSDRGSWYRVLLDLCENRFGLSEGEQLSQKQTRFLLNRGFSAELIQNTFGSFYPTN